MVNKKQSSDVKEEKIHVRRELNIEKLLKTQNTNEGGDNIWWPSLISQIVVNHFGYWPWFIHVVVFLEGSHYQKSKHDCYGSTINTETSSKKYHPEAEINNKKQIPRNLSQSSTFTCWYPSWMAAISWITKITIMAQLLKIETCNKTKWPTLNLGQSSILTSHQNDLDIFIYY